jgi:hypothetical protein
VAELGIGFHNFPDQWCFSRAPFFRRRVVEPPDSELLIPWKMGEPECWRIGVMECWKTQYSITPALHFSWCAG